MNSVIYCENLVLEVGRKCNLHCEHCLRGEAEELTMPIETAKAILDGISAIGFITFTGGEPALYGEEISEIVDYIIKRNIPLESFYVATNGTIFSETFFMALVRLYAYCYEPEMCALDISDDHWHEEAYTSCGVSTLYSALSFCRKKGDMAEAVLVSEGRAAENGWGNRHMNTKLPFAYDYSNNGYLSVDLVYVNAKGDILPDCDYSYRTQETMDAYNIADVLSKKMALTEIFENYNRRNKE